MAVTSVTVDSSLVSSYALLSINNVMLKFANKAEEGKKYNRNFFSNPFLSSNFLSDQQQYKATNEMKEEEERIERNIDNLLSLSKYKSSLQSS